jgi:hypothetical protein
MQDVEEKVDNLWEEASPSLICSELEAYKPSFIVIS